MTNPITPVQRGRLPAYVRTEYPAFEAYMMEYFHWLREDGNFVNIIESWKSNTDPINAVDPYIDAILRDLGWTWEGETSVTKQVLLLTLREFYLARGTVRSFEYLFRVLFDEPVSVKYPRERMLVPSQANYARTARVFTTAVSRGGVELEAILRDLQNFELVTIRGMISGTVLQVENLSIIFAGSDAYLTIGIEIPEKTLILQEDVMIESPSGRIIETLHNVMGLKVLEPGSGITVGDEVVVTGASLSGIVKVTSVNGGEIDSITILDGGSGYEVGEPVTAEIVDSVSNYGFGFYGRVGTVDIAGSITSVKIENRGRGYKLTPDLKIKTVSGIGGRLAAGSDSIGGIDRITVRRPYVNFDPSTVTVTCGNAVLEVIEETVFYTNAFEDRIGVLGENSTLIDSNRYQQFSYDLISAVPPQLQEEIVDDLLHPVGYIRTTVLGLSLLARDWAVPLVHFGVDEVPAPTYILTHEGAGIMTQSGKAVIVNE